MPNRLNNFAQKLQGIARQQEQKAVRDTIPSYLHAYILPTTAKRAEVVKHAAPTFSPRRINFSKNQTFRRSLFLGSAHEANKSSTVVIVGFALLPQILAALAAVVAHYPLLLVRLGIGFLQKQFDKLADRFAGFRRMTETETLQSFAFIRALFSNTDVDSRQQKGHTTTQHKGPTRLQRLRSRLILQSLTLIALPCDLIKQTACLLTTATLDAALFLAYAPFKMTHYVIAAIQLANDKSLRANKMPWFIKTSKEAGISLVVMTACVLFCIATLGTGTLPAILAATVAMIASYSLQRDDRVFANSTARLRTILPLALLIAAVTLFTLTMMSVLPVLALTLPFTLSTAGAAFLAMGLAYLITVNTMKTFPMMIERLAGRDTTTRKNTRITPVVERLGNGSRPQTTEEHDEAPLLQKPLGKTNPFFSDRSSSKPTSSRKSDTDNNHTNGLRRR